jgi:lipopolysaccharide/colanic/teichoic acid biosynthesis glycosyltransferase
MEELLLKRKSKNEVLKKMQTESDSLRLIPRKTSTYVSIKYITEYIITAIAVIVLLPVFGIVAAAIKLDSRGPVLFKHTRYGLKGNPFKVLKFRTMVEDAHSMQDQISHLNEMNGGKLFKSDSDPRVTRLGKFLRKTSIDELPQLFNILIGDMTIIGPRPLSTPLNEYEEENLDRFQVKPGLGCIWQAYFRKGTDFDIWMKTDVIYVKNVSPILDIKLLLLITKNVLVGKGAR